MQIPGEDFEVTVHLSLEDAARGTQVDLALGVPEMDSEGRMRHVPKTIKARIPKGATDGQRLRLRGQGGKGLNGGPNGDLYLNIVLHPHALFRPTDTISISTCRWPRGRPRWAPRWKCRRWAAR